MTRQMETIQPLAVAISGEANAGKTRLVERLTWGWTREGLRVATVKHAAHGFDSGRAGSDSERHLASGAIATLLVGPDAWSLEWQHPHEETQQPSPQPATPAPQAVVAWLLRELARRGARPDRILLEGFKHGNFPRVWVEGAEALLPQGTLARVVPLRSEVPTAPIPIVPVFHADDASGLASHLERALEPPRDQSDLPGHRNGDASTATAYASAAILTGGRSRRMGRDKALLPVAGIPMLERVLWSVRHLPHTFFVTTCPASVAVWQRRIVPEDRPGEGPLAALEAALAAAASPIVVLLACDMPFWPPDGTRWLLAALADDPRADVAIATSENRRHPLCAAYRTSLAASVSALLDKGERSMESLLARVRTRSVEVPPRWVENVNTPQEARRLDEGLRLPDGDIR